MGWSGHGIYDGDDTQTRHYDFIIWSGLKVTEDQILEEEWLHSEGTKIPKKYLQDFIKGIPKIIKKLPKIKKYWKEQSAIEWQMFIALLLNNKIKPSKFIYDQGIAATEYLMGEDADDFCEPARRRAVLAKFIQKIKKNKYEKA